MMIKYLPFFILLFLGNPTNCCSQNELKARIEYDEAEKAFADNNFEACLSHLDKAEQNLGQWTSKVCYLKIVTLDKLCDYDNLENSYTKLQQKEVGLYMAYANKNQDVVDLDKFKTVYKIDEKLKVVAGKAAAESAQTKIDIKAYAEFKQNKKMYEEMAEYKNGNKAWELKEHGRAMELFKAAAAKGNPVAESDIGVMYKLGIGVPKNEPEAIKWFTKAAEKGDMEALYRMSNIGDDAKINFDILLRCANAGHESCCSSLAHAYRFGKGVSEDYSKAMQFYLTTANKGDFLDIENIAELYYEGGHGLTQSKEEAFKWYLKAATLAIDDYGRPFPGSKSAMYKLYQMYNTGDGVQKNTAEAYKWLLKMAEVAKDDQTATEFDWIGQAYFTLGSAYENGLAVEQNYTEALKWFTKGSEKTKEARWFTEDNVACMEKVIQFYNEGLGVKKDKKIAAAWQEKYEAAKKEVR